VIFHLVKGLVADWKAEVRIPNVTFIECIFSSVNVTVMRYTQYILRT